MEGRGQEMDNGSIPNTNSVNYNIINPPKISQQVVKLPLAPIVSTPPDRRIRRGNVATRRGSAIFSPTQTLDQNDHQNNYKLISSPPPQPVPLVHTEPTPDPAPAPAPAPASDPDPPNTALLIKYRECLKNHAANIGGHVVDGCGEFMPSGDEGTPEALRCDACDCHRNFHRKEIQGQSLHYHAYGPSSQHTNYNPTPTAMFNFGGGRTAESSSEDLGHAVMQPSSSGSKKRFRTKFNKEQKERMSDFAEKLDWKMQKKDDKEIHKFCTEVGVNREVFKVFMHNTKQAMKKRQI